jgi:hypothetical protein
MKENRELGVILKEGLKYQYGIAAQDFVAEVHTFYEGHRTAAAVIREENGTLDVVVSSPERFGGYRLYRMAPEAAAACRAVLLRMAKETVQDEKNRLLPGRRHACLDRKHKVS